MTNYKIGWFPLLQITKENHKIGCKTNDGRIGRNVRIYVISTKTRRVFTTVLGIGR